MDDRTTIAKDVLCAMLTSSRTYEVIGGGLPKTADDFANIAVAFADGILARTTNPQPAPKPPSSWSRWRKMSEIPVAMSNSSVSKNVLVVRCGRDDDTIAYILYYDWKDKLWRKFPGCEEFVVDNSYRWTEIPTPEVSE